MPQNDRFRMIPDPQTPSNRTRNGGAQSPRPASSAYTQQMPQGQRYANAGAHRQNPYRSGTAQQGSYGQQTQQRAHQGQSVQEPRRVQGARTAPAGYGQTGNGGYGRQPGERKSNKSGAKVAVFTVLGLVAIIYIVGVVAFSGMTYPNTKIAGVDVSFSSASGAASRVSSAWKHYKLNVTGDTFTWTYQPDSSEPIVDGEKAAQEIISKNEPFAWPARLISSLTGKADTATAATTIDLDSNPDLSMLSSAFNKEEFEQGLGAAVDEFNANRSGTFDATGAYDETQAKFTVEKAQSNEKLNREHVIKYAEIELAALSDTVDLTKLGNDAYEPLNGNLTNDKIQAACDAANNFLGVNVTLKLNGNDAGKIDGSTILQWISFADPSNPTIDTSQVDSWAQDFANGYNTIGTTRTWTRADGKQCSVEGGDYGWTIDSDSLAKQVADAINNKQTGEIDISYSKKGDTFTKKGEPDWKAYIDVDLSEQHARYYDENGNIVWEANFISGNPNIDGDATPEGVYYIKSNDGASTLVGAKDPSTGQPSYRSPVSYWMPFEGNLVGFHDATWQADSSFDNSEAYKTVGSHGCINLRLDDAKTLHEKINVGLCVVVHS